MSSGMLRVVGGLLATLGMLFGWAIVFPMAIMTVVLYIVRFLPLSGRRRKRLRERTHSRL
jgi:uncharacterized membrane protein